MLESTDRPPHDGTAQRDPKILWKSLSAPQTPSKGLVMSLLPSSPMFNLLPSLSSLHHVEPLKSAATEVPHSKSFHSVIPRVILSTCFLFYRPQAYYDPAYHS